jgi:ammonium transporter, Amt family
MTPGLAFFYGGMVRSKNVISVLMHNYVTMGLVSLLWVVGTYSIAFGPDVGGNGLFGNLHFAGLGNITDVVPGYTGDFAQVIPPLVFVSFQLMFAIITPALFTGAIAERMKLLPFVGLIALWSILVYAPVAHWVFSPQGWLFKRGALDFAGGTVVHINAGAAALALALVLGKRKGWPKAEVPMHNVPFVVLGAGLLWFGWFGFNAGSALGANNLAAYAFINTNTAAGVALLGWILVERLRGGKPTAIGAASGAVAGLVAITPAAGFVNPVGAIVIGALAGIICCLACGIKYRAKYDDALDVVGVHLFGGLIGALAVGFLGTKTVNSLGADGVFYGGDWSLLGDQALAVVAVGAYSFAATFVIASVLKLVFGGLRVVDTDEDAGLDLAIHGEVAYDYGFGTGSLGGGASEEAIAAERILTHSGERTGKQE